MPEHHGRTAALNEQEDFGSIVFTVFAKVPVYYVKYIPDIDTGKLKFYPICA